MARKNRMFACDLGKRCVYLLARNTKQAIKKCIANYSMTPLSIVEVDYKEYQT